MRTLIDTNVILSALMFPDSTPAKALYHAAEFHEIILCDYIISEIREKVALKRPDLLKATETLIQALPHERVSSDRPSGKTISDPKDQPILDTAIAGGVDIIISGDKHFKNLDIDKPKVLSPAEFLAAY